MNEDSFIRKGCCYTVMAKKSKKLTNKKEVIRQAAVKVIADNGYYNTKISQVAREGDIAVGTIYNYFESKEEILEYIFAVELKKRIMCLDELNGKDLPFLEKISFFLENHFSELKENIDIAKILVREKEFPRSAKSSAISNYIYKIPEKIESLINLAVEKREIRKCNSEIISAILFGAIQGIVVKAIKDKNYDLFKKGPEEIINLLQKGL